ncbi:MAG TPA: energy-coupling factor ABC transporter permease [Bacillota bacterium]|nr:energy-coupling factor ABC transporter permease [Bacillota bacterium]
MHMADALISPAVGGALWTATVATAAYAVQKVQSESNDDQVPLMGVLGAFVFAAQMINFAIPGTGSSGHLGGGLLLAILLGPAAGFLTLTTILTVQALFFADGGLLALGCNIFNLGFYTCFVAYPLIYRPLVKEQQSHSRSVAGALLAAVVGLQLGSLSVVGETFLSGVTALPFKTFLFLMQPIHLAIGIVEGLVTAAVVVFIWKARPEILERHKTVSTTRTLRPVLIGLLAVALLTGGVVAWFASSQPDGLEWSLFRSAGQVEVGKETPIHRTLAAFQEKLALLPDYNFKKAGGMTEDTAGNIAAAGTSTAGLAGACLTLGLAAFVGLGLKMAVRRSRK